MTATPESPDDLLRQGVAALKMGDRALAANLLARAVRSDPQNEQAWLYLAGAVSDSAQRRTCLERVLSLNPHNEAARQGLRGLGSAPAPAPTPTPSSHPASALTSPPTPKPPPPARTSVLATSTTMRLAPTFAPLENQTRNKAIRHPADRLVWVLILVLGLMLMLGSGTYAIILLRG